ncbi:hypothetical protein J4214_01480 [Candidatus Woesearchaeota archaeon]|nr:hypothetical protein [Candidatus Woesearchaeota archaeon]
MTGSDILNIRNRKCPACHNKTDFFHIGTQKGVRAIDDVAMYTCSRCGTSISFKSLSKENPGMY